MYWLNDYGTWSIDMIANVSYSYTTDGLPLDVNFNQFETGNHFIYAKK